MNTIETKIYYEDTDCGGVVYYANYLKYMERGRTEFLLGRGVSVKELMERGVLFVVNRAEIDFRSSGKYGETIIVKTWIAEITGVSILFAHSMTDKATGRLIVESQARLVCVDTTGRPRRLPADVAEKIK